MANQDRTLTAGTTPPVFRATALARGIVDNEGVACSPQRCGTRCNRRRIGPSSGLLIGDVEVGVIPELSGAFQFLSYPEFRRRSRAMTTALNYMINKHLHVVSSWCWRLFGVGAFDTGARSAARHVR
jgi:hypothetical protein